MTAASDCMSIVSVDPALVPIGMRSSANPYVAATRSSSPRRWDMFPYGVAEDAPTLRHRMAHPVYEASFIDDDDSVVYFDAPPAPRLLDGGGDIEPRYRDCDDDTMSVLTMTSDEQRALLCECDQRECVAMEAREAAQVALHAPVATSMSLPTAMGTTLSHT
jgi:hypothetical protein